MPIVTSGWQPRGVNLTSGILGRGLGGRAQGPDGRVFATAWSPHPLQWERPRRGPPSHPAITHITG